MKYIQNKIKFVVLSFFFLFSNFVEAATTTFNPLKVKSMEQLIGSILSGLTYILVPFIVLAFVYAGFLFVSAQGNTEKINTAKKALLYSVIGAVLILGANIIFKIVTSTVSGILTT